MKIMYSLLYVVVILVGLLGHLAQSCPMCVGKLEADSPAFFADEYYQAVDADAQETPVVKSDAPQKTEEKPGEAQS